MHGVLQCSLGVHHAHAPASPAARGLYDHRIADLASNLDDLGGIIGQGAFGSRHTGNAGFQHRLFGANFVTHQPYSFRTRPDEDEATFFHALGEVGILREEAVTRMDGLGIRHFSGGDYGRYVQITSAGSRGPNTD